VSCETIHKVADEKIVRMQAAGGDHVVRGAVYVVRRRAELGSAE